MSDTRRVGIKQPRSHAGGLGGLQCGNQRRCSLVIVLVVGFAACGGTSAGTGDTTGCASGFVGEWVGHTQEDLLTLSSDGSFRYTGLDQCASTGTFSCPEPATMRISIQASDGGYCLPVGDYVCAVSLNGDAMSYDCTGDGALEYRRS